MKDDLAAARGHKCSAMTAEGNSAALATTNVPVAAAVSEGAGPVDISLEPDPHTWYVDRSTVGVTVGVLGLRRKYCVLVLEY